MEFEELARRFDAPGVLAIALLGSYARGDAGPYSDVDLVRFTAEGGHAARHAPDAPDRGPLGRRQ